MFDELVSLRLEETVLDMMERSVPISLQRFYYKVKAEELICCLLMEQVKRQDHSLHSINATDLNALYLIRDRLISNLVETPPLAELAELGGMSLSKLKRLNRSLAVVLTITTKRCGRKKQPLYYKRNSYQSVK